MSIAVYPRLSELLQSRKLSVAELERRIEQRFGLSVNVKTLYRFASSEPVQRADLEIAGTVASVLGVGLGDLFDVQAIPVDDARHGDDVLDPAESRRMAELFDRQSRASLSKTEQQELEELVNQYGRRLHEIQMREYAVKRGISLGEAEQEMYASLDRALLWWQEFEEDPAGRTALEASIVEQRAAKP